MNRLYRIHNITKGACEIYRRPLFDSCGLKVIGSRHEIAYYFSASNATPEAINFICFSGSVIASISALVEPPSSA